MDIREFKKSTIEEARDYVLSKGLKSLKKDDDDFFCDILMSGCIDLNEKIELLLSAGVDVNAPTDGILNGFTPLSSVIKKSKEPLALVDQLLANGADIEIPSQRGLTPLHCAVILQNLQMIKYLVSKGANTNAVDEDGNSCLILALKSNDRWHVESLHWPFHGSLGLKKKPVSFEILDELVRAGARLDYQSSWRGSVLGVAVETGEIPIVDWLLRNGIKPTGTISSSSSTTLLMSACRSGNFSITKHLLQLGASVHAVDQDGKTALFHSSEVKIAQALLDAGADLTHLDKNGHSLFQSRYFSIKVFLKFGREFVHLGGDIHGKDADGRNILHHSADSYDGLAAIKLAITLGCDINLQDKNGITPLMLARSEYWQTLIAGGARINDVDANGDHALNLHLSQDLLDYGADVNLANKCGQTPLMLAAQKGDIPLVKGLLKAGADIGGIDQEGKMVTDYADAKALALLVEAGAPLNPKSTSALATAIFGKNASLSKHLLKAGLKAHLSDYAVTKHLAFLENIAQENLDLFRFGIFGDGKNADKLIAKIIAALDKVIELTKAWPVCENENLPEVLRLGAWPPKKPVPTVPISVPTLATPEPEFDFPPELQSACEEICESTSDKQSAAKKRSDFSKFVSTVDENLSMIENTDWDAETKKFIKNPISEVYKESSSSRIWKANELLCHHQDLAVNTYYAEHVHRALERGKGPLRISRMGFSNTFNHFVAIKTQIATLGKAELRIWSNDKDLLKDKKFISYAERLESGTILTRHVEREISVNDIGILEPSDIEKYLGIFKFVKFKWLWRGIEKIHYCALAYRIGPSASDALQSIAKTGDEQALACLSHLNAESLASFMAENLNVPGRAKYAQAWFRFFPETATTGLLKCSFRSNLNDASNAQQALRFLAASGSKDLIIDCALKFGQEAQATAIEFLGFDSRADFLPKKMPKLPAYFVASAHAAPKLKSSGEALPPHAVETLVRMMLVSTCHLQNSALQEIIEACDRGSLAEFALSTFDLWSKNGSKKDGVGFLYALAYLGDNRAAALLGKSYRNAPPTAAAPVIEVLAAIGSNTAIAGLQAIARSSANEKSQKIAQEVLEDVARVRGLTPAMLEDLAVPDLGLDPNGQMSLDFGPRKFVVTINANIEAVLTDEHGDVQKTLPKPVKADNAHKAKIATAQWKEFKTALKGQAADQKKRLEQAMLTRREWDGATFKEIVAVHPLLSKIVCSLVWATVKSEKPDTAFRIDTDGHYVTADGAELTLDDGAMITLPHPLLLGDKGEAWLRVFAENKLTQPFPQLARKWFAEGSETQELIKARDGTKVPLGSLRGLKAKGWDFSEGRKTHVWSVYRHMEGGSASIDVEPGWFVSGYDHDDIGGNQTVKLDVRGSDPIAYSELVRDFLSLPVVEAQ